MLAGTMNNPFQTLREFNCPAAGKKGFYYSVPALEQAGIGQVSKMPVCLRVVLESVLRNCDGTLITENDVRALANWNAEKPADTEIPFTVARVLLQDLTGVALLVDLAAMRDAVAKLGRDPALIEPLVPMDMVVDHSVQIDYAGTPDAFRKNIEKDFSRNTERYELLKWGQGAFKTFSVVPPAVGICHQVNLEYLARVVFEKETPAGTIFYPDSVVGTDSHTTMVNGIGVVGWGVGGIEAEAGMLGQPVCFQTPEVIGVHLTGTLPEGVLATDLALRVTEILRAAKVVGKFVEFFGEGAATLSLADRATVANMAPEYGATMGFFPVDEKTLDYLRLTGRDEKKVAVVRDYLQAQGLFGMPKAGEINYTKVVELDLSTITRSVAGPKRPQDRIELGNVKNAFDKFREETKGAATASGALRDGSVVIAAITSCTNTSNPSVLIAAGLLAKRAVEKGLSVPAYVKTSLAPGSRVVTDYLNATGLTPYLDKLGFNLVGYGCATCIGNSGPLAPEIETAIRDGKLITASVLSGNRNFEARIHPLIKSNFLMSPPLVVAFALAGRVDIDLENEPIGTGTDGQPVYLKDIWPKQSEIDALISAGVKPEMFAKRYASFADATEEWETVPATTGALFGWRDDSTYVQLPPYFDGFGMALPPPAALTGMRPLAILGDSVTTDHISPAGAFAPETPAGKYLTERGIPREKFNTYGSRRGNDRIMVRGTFANVRIKNKMADGKEGGFTKLQPAGTLTTIFEASEAYKKAGTPLIVFAGVDYGMGSSRDWAAKGAALLGVRAVVAQSFERIHRSNLIGMGVLPLEFTNGESAETLGLDGTETFDIEGLENPVKPKQNVTLVIRRANGEVSKTTLLCRIDTLAESHYLANGGILQYVLRKILG
ncbi:MAG: aconitate hydratase AcnA [Opitutales bacterium]|nr:aconitate hydratase AcnA [Opitutales bacterium]